MAPKLVISGLGKSFGDLDVLRRIDVSVERGLHLLVDPPAAARPRSCRIVAELEPASSRAKCSTIGRVVR